MQKLIKNVIVHLANHFQIMSGLEFKNFFKLASVCLVLSFTLTGCGSGGGDSGEASQDIDKEEQSGTQCLGIPKALTQGTGNLAIFNSLDTNVLLSYSNELTSDDVIAVIKAKQNGVKVDISQRTSSTVMVFGFKMPEVKNYVSAGCDASQMPTSFVQSEFIPTAESSFVLEASNEKQDYGTLLVKNNRSGLVSIFQGSSQNKQIGVVQAKQFDYRIQLPVGYKQLLFYLHKKSGGIDFENLVFGHC